MRRKAKKNDNPVTRKDTSSKARKVTKIKQSRKVKKVISPRVKRTRNAATWTEAKYFSVISNALRDAFRYWKPMYDALKKYSRKSQAKNKLIKVEYQCNHCKDWFPRNRIEIDHILPAGALRTYEDLVPYLIRLTPENEEAFQPLCKSCHLVKSAEENKIRRETSRLLKITKDNEIL